MKSKTFPSRFAKRAARDFIAIMCVLITLVGFPAAFPLEAQEPTTESAPLIPADQLDSLVAPIALYPDPMLAQTLAASTYPLEVMQLQQWLVKNPNLKDQALADAVAKQPWDPSVQAMAGLPDVVKRLSDDIQWATDLGNAFLAQQSDVMDAVQRMRKKAQGTGNLESSEQMKVETKVVETKEIIIVEQSNPQIVYVPSYDPVVVYGPPVYPYPPIYYPPPGYYAAGMAISFGVGVAMGACCHGGWGWGAGWGHNDIDINVNNNFNRNTNINRNTNVNRSGNKWSHNSSHRGGTPYSNRSTANRYGGTARGDSLSSRQSSARQQGSSRDSQFGGSRPSSGSSRPSTSSSRPSTSSSRPSTSSSRGGGDNIGSRNMSSRPSSSSNRSAMGGGSRSSYSGSSTRSSSSRGSSSMGSRGGGGRGGGGRR